MFFIVRDYLIKYRPDLKVVLATIYLPIVITAILFFIYLYKTDLRYASSAWFYHPALNFHIRHTGYQAAAAVAVVMLLIFNNSQQRYFYGLYIINIILWSFLFWMGGRGSILAVWITALAAVYLFYYLRVNVKNYIKHIVAFSIIGIILSEVFVVFQWNGLLSSVFRSVSSDTVNALSSGRLFIWRSVLDSMDGYYLLGLGPHSFIHMPNSPGPAHPHSMLVQFWNEWGLIGAISFIALLLIGFIKGVKLHIRKPVAGHEPAVINIESLAAASLIMVLSLHGLTDGTYYHQQPSLYLSIAFAIWTTPRDLKEKCAT